MWGAHGPRALPLATNLLSVVAKDGFAALCTLCNHREHFQFDPSSSSPAGEEVCLQGGVWRSELLLFKLGMRSGLPSISCIPSILQDPTGKMSLSGSGKGLTQLGELSPVLSCAWHLQSSTNSPALWVLGLRALGVLSPCQSGAAGARGGRWPGNHGIGDFIP